MSAAYTTSSLSPLSLPARTAAVPPAVRRGAWQLPVGQAASLRAASTSVLSVRQGRVWVTRDATDKWGSEDVVLAPGESMTVAAGQRIVMEPWDGYGATYTWDAPRRWRVEPPAHPDPLVAPRSGPGPYRPSIGSVCAVVPPMCWEKR